MGGHRDSGLVQRKVCLLKMTDAAFTHTLPRLLDQVRGKIRVKHYSIRTEQAYLDWIKRFICHFDKRHPN